MAMAGTIDSAPDWIEGFTIHMLADEAYIFRKHIRCNSLVVWRSGKWNVLLCWGRRERVARDINSKNDIISNSIFSGILKKNILWKRILFGQTNKTIYSGYEYIFYVDAWILMWSSWKYKCIAICVLEVKFN